MILKAKRNLLVALAMSINIVGFAQSTAKITQKPVLDSTVFNNWPEVDEGKISNDGKYFVYTINHEPKGSQTMVLRSINTKKEWRFIDNAAGNARFSDNSKYLIFTGGQDSLCILTLGQSVPSVITSATEFKLFMRGKQEQLVYLQRSKGSEDKRLVVEALGTGKTRYFDDVSDYWLSHDGKSAVLQLKDGLKAGRYRLNYASLINDQQDLIYEGDKIDEVIFDRLDQQLAFMSMQDSAANANHKIWYYKAETANAVQIASDTSPGISSNLQFKNLQFFGNGGDRLYCWLIEKKLPKPKEDAVMVDVWSYRDAKLQSQQLQELKANEYFASINLSNHHINQITNDDESVAFNEQAVSKEDHFIVSRLKGDLLEYFWNPAAKRFNYLLTNCNVDDKSNILNLNWSDSSPDGNYLYYLDSLDHKLFCYDVATRKKILIMNYVPIPQGDNSLDYPSSNGRLGLSIAGHLLENKGVLIYDHYDIWLIPVQNNNLPICLTNGYGRRNGIIFRLANLLPLTNDKPYLDPNKPLILNAFSEITKDNGFYSLTINKPGSLQLLSMSSSLYILKGGVNTFIKARDVKTYVVMKSDASSSANYYLTHDFREFKPLTDVHPERKWNWISSELITWSSAERSLNQGILYKPENFDPAKKYPVIFSYYERKSDGLHRYFSPGTTDDLLNIPWFVSSGYLVFVPDIYFKIGSPGQSSLITMESAAGALSKLNYVDSKRLALQGHSWSGYLTNYIVSYSNRFAAAAALSGATDFISTYNGIIGQSGTSAQFFPENGQFRIGSTLWDRPDLYIKNSPIFYTDKITTPLLMFHNKADGLVPFAQGVELFTALRRLGKPAWMLQYDGGGHGIGGKDAEDFTKRLQQFYDHYLKDAPAPVWMTQGISAKYKGINTGFEYDTEIKTPGPGLVTPEEQKKIDEYSKIPLSEKLKRIN